MPIDFDIRHPTLRVNQRQLGAVLRAVLKDQGRARAEVSVSCVEDAEIRALNAQWRGIDRVTDVLSFALDESEDDVLPMDVLGDIVVSLDTAQRQAEQVRTQLEAPTYGLQQEATFLCIHGILHLLGYDHQEAEDAGEMEGLERKYLAGVCSVDVHALDRSDHGLGGAEV